MFQKSSKTESSSKKKPTASRDVAVTILTSGCHFSGKLYCRGSSRIGGRIDGEIISEGLLIIEEGATIDAEVTAEEAVIQGKVTGRLNAKSRIELCASSEFNGDIVTPSLVITEGAVFNGAALMTQGQSTEVNGHNKAGTRSASTLEADLVNTRGNLKSQPSESRVKGSRDFDKLGGGSERSVAKLGMPEVPLPTA